MNLTAAARVLGVAASTLRLAVERGEVEAEHPLPDGPWLFNRQALQTAAARAVVERARAVVPDTPRDQRPDRKGAIFQSHREMRQYEDSL